METGSYAPQIVLEKELNALASATAGVEVKHFDRGELLYCQGERADHMFYVVRGRVRTYMLSPDGKEKTLLFAGFGDMLSDVSFYLGEDHLDYAEAYGSEVQVYQISREGLDCLLGSSLDLARALLINLSVRARRVSEELASHTFLDMRGQIQITLVQLAGQYGVVTSDGVAIDMRLTHEELAKLVGGNRARVSVCLGKLQRDGFYQVIDGRIVLAPWAAGQLLAP